MFFQVLSRAYTRKHQQFGRHERTGGKHHLTRGKNIQIVFRHTNTHTDRAGSAEEYFADIGVCPDRQVVAGFTEPDVGGEGAAAFAPIAHRLVITDTLLPLSIEIMVIRRG
ncbi:hypothetical protein D3C80_1780640 [compost metagenome]